MRLFAVVATYNRPAVARQAIDALLAQTRPPDHIILVENSEQPAFEEVRFSSELVEVFRPGRNTGAAGGFGIGVDLALDRGASHVILIDDDCTLGPEVLERLVAHQEDLPGAALAPVIWDPDSPARDRQFPPHPFAVKRVGTFHAMMVSAEILRRAGGPRQDLFFGGPDVEFGLRLASHGVEFFVCPDARATHHEPYYRRFWLFGWHGVLTGAPGRGYYTVRNRLIMRRLYPQDAAIVRIRFILAQEFVGALLSPPRLRRLRLLIKGLGDGLRGDPRRELENDVPLYE